MLSKACPNSLQSGIMHKIDKEILGISQLTRRIKTALENSVGQVWVVGEISNWTVAASGHAYFTLKDQESQIDAVMFRGHLSCVKWVPENGMEVIAHGRVSVYERRGNYQIILDEIEPKGLGALQLAFEKLKKKLEAEGLFDPAHKKQLPMLPRRIGIVTSPTGAAIRDILHVIQRRFAQVHVLLYPCRVQGVEAAREIAKGIKTLDDWGVDVMIIGRGGGSLEDLWSFNEEIVVRAVYEARTPIISAVGHEIDYALSDFAADLRAPTPSAAAELVVREQEALQEKLMMYQKRMTRAFLQQHVLFRQRLRAVDNRFFFRRPEELLRQRRQACDELGIQLIRLMKECILSRYQRWEKVSHNLMLLSPANRLQQTRLRAESLHDALERLGRAMPESHRSRLRPFVAQLQALSPLAILSRGYSLTWKLPDRELVRNSADLQMHDVVELQLGRGRALATITEILNDEKDAPHATPEIDSDI